MRQCYLQQALSCTVFTVSLFHWWKYEMWGVTLEEVGQLISRTHHHIFHCYPLTRSFSKWNPWRVCSGCLLGGRILMRWFEACMSSSAVSCPNPQPNSFRVRIYMYIYILTICISCNGLVLFYIIINIVSPATNKNPANSGYNLSNYICPGLYIWSIWNYTQRKHLFAFSLLLETDICALFEKYMFTFIWYRPNLNI